MVGGGTSEVGDVGSNYLEGIDSIRFSYYPKGGEIEVHALGITDDGFHFHYLYPRNDSDVGPIEIICKEDYDARLQYYKKWDAKYYFKWRLKNRKKLKERKRMT